MLLASAVTWFMLEMSSRRIVRCFVAEPFQGDLAIAKRLSERAELTLKKQEESQDNERDDEFDDGVTIKLGGGRILERLGRVDFPSEIGRKQRNEEAKEP